MLTDFFKPAWKSKSAEKRLNAITEMKGDNQEQQDILINAASNDSDTRIQTIAIKKIQSALVVHEMSQNHADTGMRAVASNRLNDLMTSGLDAKEFDKLLKVSPELRLRVAANAESEAARNDAIKDLSTDQLLEVLKQTVYTEYRQQIANSFSDLPTLESARKILRGKDKNAERIVKTKIEEFKQLERQKSENLETVNKLIEEAEYLSSRDDWLPEFMSRCLAHCNNWDALDFEVDNESKSRYETARTILDKQYKERLIVKEAKQSQQKTINELQSLIKKVSSQDLNSAIESVTEISEKRQALEAQWKALTDQNAPEKELTEQYVKMTLSLESVTQVITEITPLLTKTDAQPELEAKVAIESNPVASEPESKEPTVSEVSQVSDIPSEDDKVKETKPENKTESESKNSDQANLENTTDKAETVAQEKLKANKTPAPNANKKPGKPIQPLTKSINKLQWQSNYGALQLKAELQETLAEWKKEKKDEEQNYEKQLSAAHKNVSSIFHFARIGNLGRAKQIAARTEKALDKFSGKDHAALKVRFDEAFDQLGNMGDWKSFATEPKYIELCEAMEQLIGSKSHPDKLFEDMKAVQQQWKALGSSDISEQYWARFKEAADKVYEPCDIFFKERKALRKNNLDQRQQHVIAMKELFEQTEWDNKPDYKKVETGLRNINANFVAIKDVEHKAGRKQWTQFVKYKDEIYAKLDVVYNDNIESKQQLVQQAEALAQAEVKEDNLNTLKNLQHRWKQIGITRRKEDQIAWKTFKGHCDEVYNQIQSVRQGQRDENDQQLNAYRDIIKSIRELAKNATELSEADHQFAALQASYAELPALPEELPEKLIEGIQRDYNNACSQFDECHDRIINGMRKDQLQGLRKKAALCAQLESLYAENETPDASKLEEINTQWEAIELEDREFNKRIEARRKSASGDTANGIDRKAITEERRMMCIKLEIAKGSETPAEDKAERMQFQLDQMNQSGLGLQELSNADQFNDFQLDWLCMPGAEADKQTALDTRFWAAFDSNKG